MPLQVSIYLLVSWSSFIAIFLGGKKRKRREVQEGPLAILVLPGYVLHAIYTPTERYPGMRNLNCFD